LVNTDYAIDFVMRFKRTQNQRVMDEKHSTHRSPCSYAEASALARRQGKFYCIFRIKYVIRQCRNL